MSLEIIISLLNNLSDIFEFTINLLSFFRSYPLLTPLNIIDSKDLDLISLISYVRY